MSEVRSYTISWDGILFLSEGDEIEIINGHENGLKIRAFVLNNISAGRTEQSSVVGMTMSIPLKTFSPPLRGFAKNIQIIQGKRTEFELDKEFTPYEISLSRLSNEASKFFISDLERRCLSKSDSEDALLCAFKVLEEKIREKTGAGHEVVGIELARFFHHQNGDYVFGDTESEREGFYFLLRGVFQLFRNPPAHRFVDTYTKFDTFELLCLINLIITILDKCESRI